jgi:hypothetical protein
MSGSLAIGSALPPAIDSFMKRAQQTGGAPLPLVELNTHVAGLGPFHIDNGGAFTLTVYAGPSMHFSASPKLGSVVHAVA